MNIAIIRPCRVDSSKDRNRSARCYFGQKTTRYLHDSPTLWLLLTLSRHWHAIFVSYHGAAKGGAHPTLD